MAIYNCKRVNNGMDKHRQETKDETKQIERVHD